MAARSDIRYVISDTLNPSSRKSPAPANSLASIQCIILSYSPDRVTTLGLNRGIARARVEHPQLGLHCHPTVGTVIGELSIDRCGRHRGLRPRWIEHQTLLRSSG